jgi:hypothetical protein
MRGPISIQRKLRTLAGLLLAATGCAPSLTIPPSLARRVTIVPIQVEGARFGETEIRTGSSVAHDIHTTGTPRPNPSGTYIGEDRYGFSYAVRVNDTEQSAVDCEAVFGYSDGTFGNASGPDVEMRTPTAVKIQLACNVRPLAASVRGGHFALKTREGMFNLAPTVVIGGDLDLDVTLQSSGISATRGWTLTVGVDFSTLTGAKVAVLDLRRPASLRMSQHLSAQTRGALESLVPAFILYSSYERLRMRSD